jgi:hypothetical protein
MRNHSFYPAYPTAYPTRTPWVKKFTRFLRWFLLFCAAMLLVLATVAVIAKLNTIDAQLDSAFMQGMAAGGRLCRGGV